MSYSLKPGVVTGDDRVPIGQSLRATGVIKETFSQVLVGDAPENLPPGIDFNDAVSVGAGDQRVAVLESNRGKRPVPLRTAPIVGRKRPQDLARGRVVFLDGEIEKMRSKVIPIGQHPQHPRLHVEILLLTPQRCGPEDLSLAIDHQRPRLRPQFGNQELPTR